MAYADPNYTRFTNLSCGTINASTAVTTPSVTVSSSATIPTLTTATAFTLGSTTMVAAPSVTNTNLSTATVNFNGGTLHILSIPTSASATFDVYPSGGFLGQIGTIIVSNLQSVSTVTFGDGTSASFSTVGTLAASASSVYAVTFQKGTSTMWYEIARTVVQS